MMAPVEGFFGCVKNLNLTAECAKHFGFHDCSVSHLVQNPLRSSEILVAVSGAESQGSALYKYSCATEFGSLSHCHDSPITCMAIAKSGLCITGLESGLIMFWDSRLLGSGPDTNQRNKNGLIGSVRLTHSNESDDSEVLSCALSESGESISVSLGSNILFFDSRMMSLSPGSETPLKSSLVSWQQIHADRVTSLKYHPSNQRILLSGGEDSIVNVTNTTLLNSGATFTPQADSGPGDDAVVGSLCVNDGIRTIDFGGSDHEIILCLHDSETYSAWKLPNFTAEISSLVGSSPDIQSSVDWGQKVEVLLPNNSAIRDSPILKSDKEDAPRGYLVSSIYDDFSSYKWRILAATVDGGLEMFSGDDTPTHCWSFNKNQGHGSVVRCAILVDTKFAGLSSLLCVATGGDDGNVCLWAANENSTPETTPSFTGVTDRKKVRQGNIRQYS